MVRGRTRGRAHGRGGAAAALPVYVAAPAGSAGADDRAAEAQAEGDPPADAARHPRLDPCTRRIARLRARQIGTQPRKRAHRRFVVIRLDLEDFFASIAASRVYGIFRTAGYPESVAHSLTALTTNVVPARLWTSLPRPADSAQIDAHHRLGRRLATPHLPQGAPTSPALANLAAFRLDRRLAGLAASLEVSYTRYADDLTFSGPTRLVRAANTLRRAVAEIARRRGIFRQ